jgi:hypothetical protein
MRTTLGWEILRARLVSRRSRSAALGSSRAEAGDHLERDLLAELLVAREVDGAHAPGPEQALDDEATGDPGAGADRSRWPGCRPRRRRRRAAGRPAARRGGQRRDALGGQAVELGVELEVDVADDRLEVAHALLELDALGLQGLELLAQGPPPSRRARAASSAARESTSSPQGDDRPEDREEQMKGRRSRPGISATRSARSDLLAAGAELGQHDLDAALVDDLHAVAAERSDTKRFSLGTQ